MTYAFKPSASGSVVVPYPAKIPPGTWAVVSDRTFGSRVPQVVCPLCCTPSILSPEIHSVAADGTVRPSLICLQYDFSQQPPVRCTFHDHVILEGWTP
ncbi:MAG: hypothetical protein KGJ23_08455 [Euryarchaeota archaeon]|nr:hypothetical protein [Euryarchaeota archaeon]MDE1836633.1 hypothetical protein [Euryarchaeota archaeon]MDE1879172.1 hypothetical protein [Euryarchaeota archaeon]MDE2044603.1 hypothetical protein [Thermoplasmata archaeon]